MKNNAKAPARILIFMDFLSVDLFHRRSVRRKRVCEAHRFCGMTTTIHFLAEFSRKNQPAVTKKRFHRHSESEAALHQLVVNQLIRPRVQCQASAIRMIHHEDHEYDQSDEYRQKKRMDPLQARIFHFEKE